MDDDSIVGFIQEVTGDSHLRVETDLGDGFVRLKSSEAERRQAKHDIRSTEDIVIEMLRNARDAGAHLIYVATTREGNERKITMIDDGDGIPAGLQETVFEPRVTSKLDSYHMDKWGVHGRGMALFSIRCNAQVSHVVTSAPGKGASLFVETDVSRLPERKDQSSMPRFVKTDDGTVVLRGPRNINRTVAEFVTETKDACSVYLGSPNDALATLVAAGRRALGIHERTFPADQETYPVCLRPALAQAPDELAEIAAHIGLDVSDRSARRILDGEIAPLAPFITHLNGRDVKAVGAAAHTGHAKKAVSTDARGLKMTAEDLDAFADEVGQAYADLANSYYLDPDVQPQVRVSKDGLHINIPTLKLH